MKRKSTFIILNALLAVSACSIVACNKSSGQSGYEDKEKFQEKELNVYREKDHPDEKKFKARFYENTPNIPYVNVKDYYKEFFAHEDYKLNIDNSIYEFTTADNSSFMRFDIAQDILIYKSIGGFSNHSESIRANGKNFLHGIKETVNGYEDKVIPLYQYNIDIHGDKENLYVPLSFLSLFSGGDWMYSVTYNGQDIYVLDRSGVISNGLARTPDYYGESYFAPMMDLDTPRGEDVAKYTYGQFCLTFDHFRGYTAQLSFGDNNLLSLGTNGLLEEYHPQIKELLLSTKKADYYAGYSLLLGGMYDGGHTATLMNTQDPTLGIYGPSNLLDATKYADELAYYNEHYIQTATNNELYRMGFGKEKAKYIPEYIFMTQEDPIGQPNYYHYDADKKTAYLGFDSFVVDSAAWDEFYKNHKTPDQAPVDTDSFAFIRSKFYQAKADGAKNLVLDLSTNSGGNSGALIGILGLFNKAKGFISFNNVDNKTRETSYCGVDVNLDGEFNDADVEEASKFDFNFGVLTSKGSFSCGNLLPSLLKEIGVKTIGRTSGGGSCSIQSESTIDGLFFAHSSQRCLSNANGENIDTGVAPDLELPISFNEVSGYLMPDCSQYYDLATIGDYLTTAYQTAQR